MQYFTIPSPQVLTDPIFLEYGGQVGTSTVPQRQAAFALAEELMVEELHSFLVPTTVTGTFYWKTQNPIQLDFGWVTSIDSVSIHAINAGNPSLLIVDDAHYQMRSLRYGLLDLISRETFHGCLPPYNIQVVYTSGLLNVVTGTVQAPPTILAALTLVAQIQLNEFDVSLSNESTGDVGIEFFINQRYHEKRVKIGKSAFGNSALAYRASNLVKRFRAKPSIGFH